MTLTQSSLLIACLLPVACAGLAKAGRYGLRANHEPREWLARQQGWRARANAAQANSFEALPLFIAALWVAQQHGLAQGRTDMLAASFVALRVVYIGLYVADLATLRTLVWTAGIACCVALFVL